RMERLDLLHQRICQALAGDVGDAGNVVDRLFRIKLGALAADLVENIDEVRLDIEQAQLEHRKQANRSGADDQHIGLDGLTHYSSSYSRAPFFTSPGVLALRSSPRKRGPSTTFSGLAACPGFPLAR